MVEFATLRPKTCSYLTDGNDENEKAQIIVLESENLNSKIINTV